MGESMCRTIFGSDAVFVHSGPGLRAELADNARPAQSRWFKPSSLFSRHLVTIYCWHLTNLSFICVA
jgi:hypothetical protein